MPRVTFFSKRKSPKIRQGGTPGPPEGGTLSPLRRCRTPQIGLQTLTQTDLPLEFVGRPVFFSPGDWQRSHFLLSIRGAAGSLPPRIPRAFLSSTNTARAEGGGIQGGPPPCAGGPGTRRFLAYLCLLSLREKVGRGAGRSARIERCRDCRPAKAPGVGAVLPPIKQYSSAPRKGRRRCCQRQSWRGPPSTRPRRRPRAG